MSKKSATPLHRVTVGAAVGEEVGASDGVAEGTKVGNDEGAVVGVAVGSDVGVVDGKNVGAADGIAVGEPVGPAVGECVQALHVPGHARLTITSPTPDLTVLPQREGSSCTVGQMKCVSSTPAHP